MKLIRPVAALLVTGAAALTLTGCVDYNAACNALARPTAAERAALAGGAEVEREVPSAPGSSTMIDCELTPGGSWQRETEN